MISRSRGHILIALFLLVFSLAFTGDTVNQSDIDQSLLDEEYPHDLDTLEEFIQSYYLLLDTDEYMSQFSFLDTDKNVLQKDSLALKDFYIKLLELRNGVRDRVSIYQVGDSHIQSGYFAGTARSSMQKHFGNAGRGLTFPLRLARTNQPDDYRITSGVNWARTEPFGMSGFTIRSSGSGTFSIRTNDFFDIDNRHDKIRLYTNAEDYRFSLGQQDARTQTIAGFMNLICHELRVAPASSQIDLQITSGRASGALELYGMVLERDEPGLLYHAAGVNGASFRSYAANPGFFKQVSALQPDLIIVSLGTNDSQGNYRAENFRRELESFMRQVKAEIPGAAILFTLAPDGNKRGRTNADIYRVNDEIKTWANANGAAVWDLADLMGGSGSMRQWKSRALAANDMLHFSPKGYMLQGYLMYQAILKGYKSYTETPR